MEMDNLAVWRSGPSLLRVTFLHKFNSSILRWGIYILGLRVQTFLFIPLKLSPDQYLDLSAKEPKADSWESRLEVVYTKHRLGTADNQRRYSLSSRQRRCLNSTHIRIKFYFALPDTVERWPLTRTQPNCDLTGKVPDCVKGAFVALGIGFV